MENIFLKDDQRKEIKLGKCVAWGEQEVYEIVNDDSLVIKRFKAPIKELQDKISFMITYPPNAEKIFPNKAHHIFWAWPKKLIYNAEGRFDGYALPKVQGQNGYDFMRLDSKASWKSRLRAAFYLTKLVSSTHSASYIIGDLNPRSIVINKKSLPTIINTDSFQINNGITGKMLFPCLAADLEYAAPEARVNQQNLIPRKVNEDYFSLSIYIFQLLMLGTHPYLNTSKDHSKQNISDSIIAGENILFTKGVTPPATMPSLDVLTPEMQELFRRCFQEGHSDPEKRPSTTEWLRLLGNVINKGLSMCSKHNEHFYSNHQKECPWCLYIQKHQFDPFNSKAVNFASDTKAISSSKKSTDVASKGSGHREAILFFSLKIFSILFFIGIILVVSFTVSTKQKVSLKNPTQEKSLVLNIWEDINANGKKEGNEPIIYPDQLQSGPTLFQDEQAVATFCYQSMYTLCENTFLFFENVYTVYFELPENKYVVTAGGRLTNSSSVTTEFLLQSNSAIAVTESSLGSVNNTDGVPTNESYTHNIGLAQYATLVGKVCLGSHREGHNQECAEEQDLTSLEVKLKDQNNLHRVIIDNDGVFELNNIFPGQATWQVPSKYFLAETEQVLELNSGENKDAGMVILQLTEQAKQEARAAEREAQAAEQAEREAQAEREREARAARLAARAAQQTPTFSISGNICFVYPNEGSCNQEVGAQFLHLFRVVLWKDNVYQAEFNLSKAGRYNFTNLVAGTYAIVLDDSRFKAKYPVGYTLLNGSKEYIVSIKNAPESRSFRYQVGY